MTFIHLFQQYTVYSIQYVYRFVIPAVTDFTPQWVSYFYTGGWIILNFPHMLRKSSSQKLQPSFECESFTKQLRICLPYRNVFFKSSFVHCYRLNRLHFYCTSLHIHSSLSSNIPSVLRNPWVLTLRGVSVR